MLKNILYLLLGAIITILIFSGMFASIAKPQAPRPTPQPAMEAPAN